MTIWPIPTVKTRLDFKKRNREKEKTLKAIERTTLKTRNLGIQSKEPRIFRLKDEESFVEFCSIEQLAPQNNKHVDLL